MCLYVHIFHSKGKSVIFRFYLSHRILFCIFQSHRPFVFLLTMYVLPSFPFPIPCQAILLCTTYTQSIRKINWTVKWKSVNGFSIHCTIFLLCFSFVFSGENFFIFFVLLFIIQFFVTVLAEKLIDHLSDGAHWTAVVWGFSTIACKHPLFISPRGNQKFSWCW